MCMYGQVVDKSMVICNIYAPNEDDPTFFQKAIEKMEEFQERDIVLLGGDFNLVMEPSIDRYNSLSNHSKSLTIVLEYMGCCNLVDIWRIRNPDKRQYRWCHDGNQKGISTSRIDMMLISGCYSDSVLDCKIKSGFKMDHSLVMMTLNVSMFDRGPGAWKLNNNLLFNQNYVNLINETIDRIMTCTPYLNHSECWLELKNMCTKVSREFSKNLVKEHREEIHCLLQLKDTLIEDLLKFPDNEDIKRGLNQITSKIELETYRKVESSMFRAKCTWSEFGEKNS